MQLLTRYRLIGALAFLLPLVPAAADAQQTTQSDLPRAAQAQPPEPPAEETGAAALELAGYRTVHGAARGEAWTRPLIQPNRTFSGNRNWVERPYRLAVILVEFPDRKRSERYADVGLYERMLFSEGEFNRRVTGQPAYGSMNDYFREQSFGQFKITGKVFDWVEVERPHSYFAESGNRGERRQALMVTAAEKVIEREQNPQLFQEFDGIAFVNAGPRPRNTILWPHRSSVRIRDRNTPYYIMAEGDTIGVHAHEFGHMISLPDKYGTGGSGLGIWCAMANGAGSGTRPRHLCAWCKIRCGWVEPIVVDPRVPQKLALRPIQPNRHEAIMIPVNESGSEFFLLENRQQLGFDAGTPQGLLIWHLGEEGRRQINNIRSVDIHLHPAHGQENRGERNAVHLDRDNVPWPRDGKTAFTPETTPSSKTKGENDFPVYLRNIRQENGIIFFELGPPEGAH